MLLRRLLQLAFALALVVVGASATLRLAANGIGCAPWPSCYGLAATADAFNASPLAVALRLAHRVAASAFALVALAVVAVGWRRWASGQRTASVMLLAVTAVLAWIGRYTPSPLPAVTLINLLGGFALLALVAYLLAVTRSGAGASAIGNGLIVLMVALGFQSAGGALISARLAGAACATECGAPWLPDAGALADPMSPGAAAAIAPPQAAQALHLGHRLGGLALVLAMLFTVSALRHRRSPRAAVAMFTAAATGAFGFVVATDAPALAAVAMHALAAGLLCASLGAAFAERREPEREVGT